MFGGTPDRNLVATEKGLPTSWDLETKKNIKWIAELGSQSYGNPTVSGGKVFVGTNNYLARDPNHKGDRGVIMCFRESDGKFLWQIAHHKLEAGRVNDWPRQGICSAPLIEGNRVYYTSNRCEIVCADTEGFLDGENDGPFKDEPAKERTEKHGDIVWKLDMIEELAVFPHNLATCSLVVHGDYLYAITANGVDEAHLNVPSPRAASFVCVNKKTGEVVWDANPAADKVLHGQWSNPTIGVVNGNPQAFFAGGDGWLYAYEHDTGDLIWKFDCNPKDSVWELGGRGTRNAIVATPVFHKNRVYLGVGQDPEHGSGPGHLWCIDATKKGDVTKSARIWHFGNENFDRTLSTVAIHEGLAYAADLSGFVYCLDADSGKQYWKHDLFAAVWGSPSVIDGHVLIGDENGNVTVFKTGKEKKKVFESNFGASVYSTPVFVNRTLYIMSTNKLYAIAEK